MMTTKKWKRYMGKACLSVGRVKWFGEEPRRAERRRKRGEKTRSPRLVPLPAFELKARGRFSEATGAGGIRARAQSWIILPKGIFIGRECMQKRGHRHKGTADLALTQLREWTHTWIQNRAVESARLRVMDCPTFLPCSFLPHSFASTPSPLPPSRMARVHFIDTFYWSNSIRHALFAAT